MKIFSKFPTVNISTLNFWLVSRFQIIPDSRFSNSCISAKYCPIITNHTSMESLFIQLWWCINPNFLKKYPYDWFCAPGSHIINHKQLSPPLKLQLCCISTLLFLYILFLAHLIFSYLLFYSSLISSLLISSHFSHLISCYIFSSHIFWSPLVFPILMTFLILSLLRMRMSFIARYVYTYEELVYSDRSSTVQTEWQATGSRTQIMKRIIYKIDNVQNSKTQYIVIGQLCMYRLWYVQISYVLIE